MVDSAALTRYLVNFHNVFGEYLPTLAEVLAHIGDLYGDVVAGQSAWAVVEYIDAKVDANCYAALCCFVFDNITVTECREIFLNECSRCKKLYPMYFFTAKERCTSPKCCMCRNVPVPATVPSFTYFIGKREEVNGFSDWANWIGVVHKAFFNCSVTMGLSLIHI